MDPEKIIDEVLGELGLCCCAQPEEAATFLRDALALVDRLRAEVWEKTLTFEAWKEEEKKLFPVVGSACFTYYVFELLDLTEHGGSVPGWLSVKGQLVLSRLTTATKES